jgi:hypothetical protein
MALAELVIRDLQGNLLSAGSSSAIAVNRSGTSQVLRVSFDPPVSDVAELVTLPVSVVAAAGTRATLSHGTDIFESTLNLEFDSDTSELLLTLTGAQDVGAFVVEFGPPVSDQGDPDYEDILLVDVNFTNNDNQAIAGNRAPSDPHLKAPQMSASIDASADVNFEWEHAYDADGDELQYSLCFSEASNMSEMKCMGVDESGIVEKSGVAGMAGFTPSISSLSAFLLASVVLMMLWRRFRAPRTKVVRRIMHLGVFFFVMGLGLSACGDKKLLDALTLPPRPIVRAVVPAGTLLESAKTYHWRVYADDAKGNITVSPETRVIETQ